LYLSCDEAIRATDSHFPWLGFAGCSDAGSWLVAGMVFMMNPKHPRGQPMTLGNMRRMGVQRLIAYCLN
jgi:hypothetical protein